MKQVSLIVHPLVLYTYGYVVRRLVIIKYLFLIERQLCYPNPCKHNGTCIQTEETTFECDCHGIGYTGKACDVLLINAPKLSALTVNSEVEVPISSYPDREFMLHLVPDDRPSLKVNPSMMLFSQERTNYSVRILARKPGKYRLKYEVKDQSLNYQLVPPAIILATNGIVNKSDYFDKYRVKAGLLQPGCCLNTSLLKKQCSSGVQVGLKSTCGWKLSKKVPYTPGIIFSSVNSFDMPVAIAGAKVRPRHSDILSNLNNDEFESNCTECSNATDKQYNKPISLNDVQSFLYHESLASTYFSHSSRLTPRWLKLNALSSSRTHDMHSYMVDLVSPEKFKTMGECSKLTTAADGLYSVMLYSGSLRVKIDKESVQLQPSRSAFCFAVNLCEGKSSPLYIAIPDEAQTVLQSLEFMHDLKNKGWSVAVNSLAISDAKIRVMSDQMKHIRYWNGKQFFKSDPNVLTNVEFTKLFSKDDTVKANWAFSGDVHLLHDNINQVLFA